MQLLLLLLLLLSGAARANLLIFVVVQDEGGKLPGGAEAPRGPEWKWMRGTSIRTDGSYHRPQLPQYHPYIYDQPVVIDTDNEVAMHEKINEWIVRECGRRGARHVDTRCFVHTTTNPLGYLYPPVPDAELFRMRTMLNTMTTRLQQPRCHERPAESCVEDKNCARFGIYGCQLRTFCGFTSRHACEATGRCVFRLGKCSSK